jgi:hypothetical protein
VIAYHESLAFESFQTQYLNMLLLNGKATLIHHDRAQKRGEKHVVKDAVV